MSWSLDPRAFHIPRGHWLFRPHCTLGPVTHVCPSSHRGPASQPEQPVPQGNVGLRAHRHTRLPCSVGWIFPSVQLFSLAAPSQSSLPHRSFSGVPGCPCPCPVPCHCPLAPPFPHDHLNANEAPARISVLTSHHIHTCYPAVLPRVLSHLKSHMVTHVLPLPSRVSAAAWTASLEADL